MHIILNYVVLLHGLKSAREHKVKWPTRNVSVFVQQIFKKPFSEGFAMYQLS